MGIRISSLPDGDPTQDFIVPGYNTAASTDKLPVKPHALQTLATPAEMRAGVVSTKAVSPVVLKGYVDTALVDSARAWRDWGSLTVVNGSGVGEGYGTALITGLRVGANTSRLTLTSVGTANSGTLYNDAALVYNNGFETGVAQPSLANDTIQLMFLARRVGGGWNLMVRFRVGGVKLYEATSDTAPVFGEIAADSAFLLHNARGLDENDGWRLTAPGALEVPPAGTNSDFVGVPFAVKHVGSTMHALALGYVDQENKIYRAATSTREYKGASTDLSEATGKLPVGNLSVTGSTNGQVPTSDGTNVSWQNPVGGGSAHPHEVSVGGEVPGTWGVGDWVYNLASNNVTLSRGTDTNNILSPKTIYRVHAFGLNTLTLSPLRLRMDEMPSGTLAAARVGDLPADKITSGTFATARIPVLGSANLGDNSVGYDQINDSSKGANRILHYNAAGNGITSSAHTDLEVNADNITSGTISNSRLPVLNANRVPNLDAGKITSGTFALARIPVLDTSKFPADIAAGVPETTDLNTQLGSEGIYRFRPYALNTPLVEAGGVLFADHDDQTVIVTTNRLDGTSNTNTAGRIYTRAREFTYGGITGVSDLVSGNLGFTQLAIDSNLNDATNGFAFYFGSTNQNTLTRPTNSPSWAVFALSRVATLFTNANGQVALVGGGTPANNNNIRVWVRPRSGNTWDTGGSDNGWYEISGTNNHDRLASIGLTVITSLHQLRSSTATDFNLWFPSQATTTHPRAVDGSDVVGGSEQPIWVSRYSLSGTDTIRFVWNHGGYTGAANAVQLAVRTTTETITGSTPSAWDLVDDNSVTSGTYSSTNGTITLTKADASTVAITGLPYVTSS